MKAQALEEVIGPLGLFPVSNPHISKSMMLDESTYTYSNDEQMMENWGSIAYEWSKFHHRTLICHEQQSRTKIKINETNM